MVTLIFISGRGSAFSSVQERKSSSIYLVKSCRANVRAFHENPDRIYAELTFIKPYIKRISHKSRMLVSPVEILEASSTNSVDPDQTAFVGAV